MHNAQGQSPRANTDKAARRAPKDILKGLPLPLELRTEEGTAASLSTRSEGIPSTSTEAARLVGTMRRREGAEGCRLTTGRTGDLTDAAAAAPPKARDRNELKLDGGERDRERTDSSRTGVSGTIVRSMCSIKYRAITLVRMLGLELSYYPWQDAENELTSLKTYSYP